MIEYTQILKYIQVIRSKVSKETVIPMFPRFISMRLHRFKMKYDLKTILQWYTNSRCFSPWFLAGKAHHQDTSFSGNTFDFCLLRWSSSCWSLWMINAVGSDLTGKAPPKWFSVMPPRQGSKGLKISWESFCHLPQIGTAWREESPDHVTYNPWDGS